MGGVAYANIDNYILRDEVSNIYQGRTLGGTLIANSQYFDMDSVQNTRALAFVMALELMAPQGWFFEPDALVTRADALGIAMRAIGRSGEALAQGLEIAEEHGIVDPARMLALGYLAVARDLEIVTDEDVEDGLLYATLWGWPLEGAITREEMAHLLFSAVDAHNSNIFDTNRPLAAVYQFADWRDIAAGYIRSVEHLAEAHIMNGDGMFFNPLAPITRGQVLQVLNNMEDILLEIHGMTRKNGTISAIRDNERISTNEETFWRELFVRVGDGSVDVLQYEINLGLERLVTHDALVYFDGTIGGMAMLVSGDRIEYIVDSDGQVLFVHIVSEGIEGYFVGHLYQVNVEDNVIILRDLNGNTSQFSLANGIITTTPTGNLIEMDYRRYNIATLFYGSQVRLELFNGVVRRINFVGQPSLVDEIRGIVVENNPTFGYLTIIDNLSRRVTMRYFENNMRVQKQEHWDISNNVGYIAQMFPGFVFNPLDTNISQIRPGDIVFIRPSADDSGVIASISAAANYSMRYGRIAQLNHNYGYTTMLMEHENGQTSWFDVANSVFITREGRPIAANNIQVGDWARVLVNEAIIGPGHVVTSVREMAVEGSARFITEIVRGNLVGLNGVQNQIIIEHAQSLSRVGWVDLREVAQFSLRANNIQYFYNGRQISRDYAMRHFARSNASVYIALENNFAGQQVRMVTFRTERDEVLPADAVIHADGNGVFHTVGHLGAIATDQGTIVRRHGRLVSGREIFAADYVASVVLNGPGRAAVVDIIERPDVSGLQIARGRVSHVRDGVSFRVQSMAMLSGHNWIFTPVAREFAIDTRTLFLNANGFVNPDTFLSYTETSVVDRVFTIITDGARASHVIDAPYANRAIRGTIFATTDSTISLRDVTIQDPVTNRWHPISQINNTMVIDVAPNTIIGRTNDIVQVRDLRAGDHLLVMTNSIPEVRVPGMTLRGYIILVER